MFIVYSKSPSLNVLVERVLNSLDTNALKQETFIDIDIEALDEQEVFGVKLLEYGYSVLIPKVGTWVTELSFGLATVLSLEVRDGEKPELESLALEISKALTSSTLFKEEKIKNHLFNS